MKKRLLKIGVFFLSLIPALTFAQTSTITVPVDFNSEIWTQASALFTSFSGYIEMIIGVILAALVIDIVISALHHRQ